MGAELCLSDSLRNFRAVVPIHVERVHNALLGQLAQLFKHFLGFLNRYLSQIVEHEWLVLKSDQILPSLSS